MLRPLLPSIVRHLPGDIYYTSNGVHDGLTAHSRTHGLKSGKRKCDESELTEVVAKVLLIAFRKIVVDIIP